MKLDNLVDLWYAAKAEHPPEDGDEGGGTLTIVASKGSDWWEFSIRKFSKEESVRLTAAAELEEAEYGQSPERVMN